MREHDRAGAALPRKVERFQYPSVKVPLIEAGKTFDNFLKASADNLEASLEAFPEARDRLAGIHDAWVTLHDHLDNSPDWFISLFALRAHSAYLGACRLALSGQAVESYMVARGCIEAALYGVYLHKHPELTPIWRDRHDDADSMKRCRNTFRASSMLKLLKSIDLRTGERIERLYERTIDYGAHPNERAIFQTTRKTEGEGFVEVRVHYLSAEPRIIAPSLKTVAQAGLLALEAFGNVFGDRMALIGLDERLRELRDGL